MTSNTLPSRSEGKGTRCKTCGHEDWIHENTLECCYGHNISDECGCKKFTPEDEIEGYHPNDTGDFMKVETRVKEKKGCGKPCVENDSSSVAAVGVAAHEAGHAIQHNRSYVPLMVRNGIFPIANFGSWLAYPLFIIGFIMGHPSLVKIGIYLFTGFVVFTVITLPVEFNASKRAILILQRSGYLSRQELVGVREVLSAASLTYVAAALTAILSLLRLLILSGRRN